jgi:uncharacterized coiled-coil DUF342 family protein
MNIKETYQKKLNVQMDELAIEIDKLKVKADKTSAYAKVEYYNQIQELRTLQYMANHKLNELKEANGDTWEELKAGMDDACSTLSDTLKLITVK